MTKENGIDCDKCPIEWTEQVDTNTQNYDTKCTRSYYGLWDESFNWEETAKLARIIANLPESKDD